MLPRSIARHTMLATTRRSGWSASVAAVASSSSSGFCALSTSSARRHPALPEPSTIDVGGLYSIKYIDLKPPPTESAVPTIVLIHGAPGSHQDYKYLIPLLRDQARVVAINLPGNGGSAVLDTRDYYQHIRSANLGHLAQDALVQICGTDEHVFVVGHSFGGHTTINVTALNEMEQIADRKINIRGLALLASAGLRIHKVLEASNLGLLHRLLESDYRLVEAAGCVATRALYTRVWGFPSGVSTEQYVAGLVRCASTDFSVINDHVARVAHVPAFFAWAKDEPFIQSEIFRELSAACAPGPRFVFDKGGHNIQKTKAAFLATQLLAWTQRVVSGDTAAMTRELHELP